MTAELTQPLYLQREASEQRVTLIRGALIASVGEQPPPVTVPIGIGYIAAVLREAGVHVEAVDSYAENPDQLLTSDGYIMQGASDDEVVARVSEDVTIIGVTSMFSQDWPATRRLIMALRKRFPEVLIIAGGEHITAVPEFSLRDCPEIDVCVLGEGEETILELVASAHQPERYEAISGLAFLREGRFVQTTVRQRMRDLRKIPQPSWDLFPMEAYLKTRNAYGVYRGRTIGILATRGCPYQCTFCSNNSMYGTRWVARDPISVLDEIQEYIEKYQVQNIDFFDLTMVLKRKWILDFCQKIEERGLCFTWQLPSGTRSEMIDHEVASALYRSGCRNLAFAPESGSQATLKAVKKRIKLDSMETAVKVALSEGIVVKLNLIIGFPNETRKDILQTILFAWRMAWVGVHDTGVYEFSPYPGSDLYDQLRDEGKISELDGDYFRSLLNYKSLSVTADYCKAVSAKELNFWRTFGMASFFGLSFLFRPARLVRLVRNVRRREGNTLLEVRFAEMYYRWRQKRGSSLQDPA